MKAMKRELIRRAAPNRRPASPWLPLPLPLFLVLAAGIFGGCGDADDAGDRGAGAETAPGAPGAGGASEGGGEGILVDGFSGPESVLHDRTADVYLVSNINGVPAAHDGNGFISRLSPSGEVLDLRWIDGENEGVTLDAPKGSGLRGDTLFVADIDVVRLFDRRTGAPLGEWPVDGAVFLNDVAVGDDGRVYVSDSGVTFGGDAPEHSGSAAIHVFTPDGAHRVLEAGDVTGINGIAVRGNRLYGVTGFGTGHVFTVVAGERIDLPELPGLRLDGIVTEGDSAMLISDWDTETVYRLRSNGSVSAVARNVETPADIGFDEGRRRLLVPGLATGRVLLLPLATARPVISENEPDPAP
jgi:hypothetical protein